MSTTVRDRLGAVTGKPAQHDTTLGTVSSYRPTPPGTQREYAAHPSWAKLVRKSAVRAIVSMAAYVVRQGRRR